MVSKHVQPAHLYDRLSNVEAAQVKELKDLIYSCREKREVYSNIMNGLNDELTELHLQKDNVKGLIDETFQTYKALLEKIKVV
jgi:tripartite motif-containing protein 2/3